MMRSCRNLLLCLMAAALLLGCSCGGGRAEKTPAVSGAASASSGAPAGEVEKGAELMASAADQGAAQALAEQYGITLVSYSDGVAVFHTDEDPQAVSDRGRAKGWPELSLNRKNKAF